MMKARPIIITKSHFERDEAIKAIGLIKKYDKI